MLQAYVPPFTPWYRPRPSQPSLIEAAPGRGRAIPPRPPSALAMAPRAHGDPRCDFLNSCHSFHDFRPHGEGRLPGPIFDYIDGAGRTTRSRTGATRRPSTGATPGAERPLRGVGDIDLSVTVMGQRLAGLSTARPRLFSGYSHHQGERAVAAAAGKYGTMFGVSSLGTVSLGGSASHQRRSPGLPVLLPQGPRLESRDDGPGQAGRHRGHDADRRQHHGGERERDKRTGFSIPFGLTLAGMMQFRHEAGLGDQLCHARELQAPAT